MSQEDFNKKVNQWLEQEGNACVGTWNLVEKNENAIVSVELAIEDIHIVGTCHTENCESKIETAVLAINDGLLKKLRGTLCV